MRGQRPACPQPRAQPYAGSDDVSSHSLHSRDVTLGELGRVAGPVYGQSAPHLPGGIAPGRRKRQGRYDPDSPVTPAGRGQTVPPASRLNITAARRAVKGAPAWRATLLRADASQETEHRPVEPVR